MPRSGIFQQTAVFPLIEPPWIDRSFELCDLGVSKSALHFKRSVDMVPDNLLGSHEYFCQNADFPWRTIVDDIRNLLLEGLDRMLQVIAEKGLC